MNNRQHNRSLSTSKLAIGYLLSIIVLLLLTGCNSIPFRSSEQAIAVQTEHLEPTSIAENSPSPEELMEELQNAGFETPLETASTVVEEIKPQDLWDRIRASMSLPNCSTDPEAEKWAKWYADHGAYLDRIQKRARPILWHVVEETEKRNLPGEMVLLPIVESAFYPFSYSHGQAAGLWQFIPGTAKEYKLEINWWMDERRDLLKSTNAGLSYLQALGKQFDQNWILALASYNSGPGRVGREVKRLKKLNLPTDFKHLKLPKETRSYVPKLLGISCVIRNPEAYGITLQEMPDTPQTAVVETGGQIDLAVAADLAGMSVDEMYALNPAFNRWATDPKAPHQLLLPLDKTESFNNNIAKLSEDQRLTWERILVKPGDTPGALAIKYNITSDLILELNQISSPTGLRAGRYIMVPKSSSNKSYNQSLDERIARLKRMPKGKQRIQHTVKPGDSLWLIARKHNITVRKLASWNGMAPKDTLKVGNKLSIWKQQTLAKLSRDNRSPSSAKVPDQRVNYRVRSGDSLWKIARKFNVHVAQIQKWNKLGSSNKLKLGQPLTIWVNVTQVASGA